MRSASVLGMAGNRPFRSPGTGRGEHETGIEVRVLVAVAVSAPPAGVHRELHEVGEPPDLLGAGRHAARKCPELVEIDRRRPVRLEVGVDELLVRELVLGVIVNVLRHIGIKDRNGSRKCWIPAPTGNFVVLDAREFVVLLPEIGFDELRRRKEPQDRDVSPREVTVMPSGAGLASSAMSVAPAATAPADATPRRRNERRPTRSPAAGATAGAEACVG